jgi:glycosyltransferase involved in cell wall biosynthesis
MHATKFGGMEKYLLEIIARSSQKGLGTFIQYEAIPNSIEYAKKLHQSGCELLLEPLQRPYVRAIGSLRSLIATTRPEVIQTHFISRKLLPFVSGLGRAYGVKKHISMVHSAWDPKHSVKNKVAFLGFDHVLAVSEAVAHGLRAGGAPSRRVRTHYMGLIDPPMFSSTLREEIRSSLGIAKDAVVFGTIAFDGPAKGMDLLMTAFGEVRQVNPSAHLLQIGIDPTSSPLAQENAGLEHVHWLGIKDHASSFLSAVDVYVQPSRSEGLGLSIVEAMAMARPVIATSVGGIPEAVIHDVTGLLVRPECPRSLAAAMIELGSSADAAHCIAMGNAGFSRFRQVFDGRRSVNELTDLYLA